MEVEGYMLSGGVRCADRYLLCIPSMDGLRCGSLFGGSIGASSEMGPVRCGYNTAEVELRSVCKLDMAFVWRNVTAIRKLQCSWGSLPHEKDLLTCKRKLKKM